MKIPKPIDQTGYERELGNLVAWFEEAIASTQLDEPRLYRHNSNSKHRQLFRGFKSADTPISTAEANQRAGFPYPAHSTRFHVARERLEDLGWIERCGTVARNWTPGRPHTGRQRVFTFRPLMKTRRTDRLVAVFLRKVELLERSRLVNQCLSRRLNGELHHVGKDNLDDHYRKQEMIQRRLRGQELQSIADDYGISRERVRQIVEHSIFGRNREG